MEFRILGRLEVLEHGQPLALGGAKQRAVLAILLLHRREAVSVDRLVDELWGERPPPTAAQTIRVYVSRLRKTLGDRVVETQGRGYLLAVGPDRVDADCFAALVADGRAALASGDGAAGVGLLDAALELWRGPPLQEFAYDPFAQAEIARLEDARLATLEDRTDAELSVGRGAELVAGLEQLVTEHPLRERLTAGLMLALYRAGRHADALAACRAARERLAEDLGLEPGPALRELEWRILQHDRTLATHRPTVLVSGRRRAGARVVAGTLVLGAVLIASALLSSGVAQPGPPRLSGTSGIVAVSTASGRLVTATPLVGVPGAISGGSGSMWVADAGGGAVVRIDPGSGVVVDRIPVGGEPGSVTSGGGAIWVASTVGATVTRIDPITEAVTQTVVLPGSNPVAIAFGDGRLWVADSVARELFEIDPATGSLRRTVSLDLQPGAIALARAAIWVAGYNNATVEKLDPTSGRTLARVHVGDGPAALAFTAGSLWVANSLDATVSRIDPTTRAVTATIPVGSGPTALAAAGGSVWVANQYSADVSRINASRDRVAGNVEVDGSPTSLTPSTGRLWVGVAANSGSHRGGTLVIDGLALASSGPVAPMSIDPAFYSFANNPQFTGLEYDSLVNFQQSPGAAGLRLVPDLALSIPTPADGATTYGFRLRPGIDYSTGQPLRAGDFRRAIERLFRVGSPGSSLYSGIVGAAVCARRPRRCDLSEGIATDNSVGTVTFHLAAPDPDFLFKLTEFAYSAPVPPGTPDNETGSGTVPGTGPYKIVAVSPTEIRFVRNPFFHEWSHAAQPTGNPNSIVWRTVRSAQAALTAIQQRRADWFFGQIPAAQSPQLELQLPAQLHSNPLFGVEFIPLNTNLPPFNDLRVRQALNYAIDRAKIAQLYGGSPFATPTCQPIAPALAGYRRYCPYTLHPRASGAWSTPNLARARRLVAQSRTFGERIEVWGTPDEGYVPPTMTAYVAGVLRTLGYRVRIHLVPIATVTQAMRTHFQLSADGDWVAPYPDPSSYIPQYFSCGGGNGNGFYCNPRLDREMQDATQLELINPGRSRALWESVDRQLTDQAVWVPTVTPREVDLTSNRLHNYEYNPVWGFLADQSWLQ
jgi:peptide/nickel transport system substrate-binding protein